VQSFSVVDLLDEPLNRSTNVFLIAVLAQVNLFRFLRGLTQSITKKKGASGGRSI